MEDTKGIITRYFVYRKKEGAKRFSHVAMFYTLEEALQEAKKYENGYVIGTDYCGSCETKKIYA